jgi:hypothetical protein
MGDKRMDASVGGYVYKIGMSDRPEERVTAFNLPTGPVTVVHRIGSTQPRWLEDHLQRHFRDQRLHGEWFRLSEEQVCLLITLAECNGPDQLPDWCLLPVRRSGPPRRKPGPIPRLKGMVKTSTVMTESLLEGLDTLARQTGKSRADLLRIAAEEMLVARGLLPGVKPDDSQTTT